MTLLAIGGQSAPPFIEGVSGRREQTQKAFYRGAVRPPSLKEEVCDEGLLYLLKSGMAQIESPFGTQLLAGCFYGTEGASSGPERATCFEGFLRFAK